MSSEDGVSRTDLILALVDSLQAAADGRDFDSLDITVDDPLTNYLGVDSPLPSQPDGIRGEVIVYRDISWLTDEFDQIGSLERWFPRHNLRIPLAIIEVTKSGNEFSGQEYLLSFDWEDQLGRHVLGAVVSPDQFSVYTPDVPASEDPFQITDHDDATGLEPIVECILDHVGSTTQTDVAELIDIENLISSIEPIVFHLEEVLNAYEENRTGILIVLLHVYFENYARSELEDQMKELKSNEFAGAFYDDWNFKTVLNACRYIGLLEDNEYNIMDKISESRNDYAHDLTAFDTEHITTAEEEGKVEAAIELYEQLTGIERTIRSDS